MSAPTDHVNFDHLPFACGFETAAGHFHWSVDIIAVTTGINV